MDVCLLCLHVVMSCVDRGLCDGLITRTEESYRVSECMWGHRNPERGPKLGMKGKGMSEGLWTVGYLVIRIDQDMIHTRRHLLTYHYSRSSDSRRPES
jgi:hypothetical protein